MRTRLLALLVPALLAVPAPALPAEAFRVIVHPSNAATSVSRRELSELYLKKVTRWPGGETVHPVEPPENSITRAYFLSAVVGKSAFAIKMFWNRRVFEGRDVPPVEKRSDEEVVAYVRATRGAVGYVSADTPIAGVKVLELGD